MILVEACVESATSAVAAERAGAARLELCGNLAEGGVTPDLELMRAVLACTRVPLHVMIRPRPGSFVFDASEEEVMLADIREARRAGADGVVIGALSSGERIHRARTERLVLEAGPLPCTFHRAIDATPDLDASVALLVELGVSRVLTSGGAATAREGASRLARLQERWGDRVTIVAGGGVRADHVAELVRATGVPEVHVGLPHGMDAQRIADVVNTLTGTGGS